MRSLANIIMKYLSFRGGYCVIEMNYVYIFRVGLRKRVFEKYLKYYLSMVHNFNFHDVKSYNVFK